ncbi:MAG: cobalamin-binding protein [Methanoregula sp.]|nr:cobalamin-binding protein [Methanoregula sp.]
MTGKILHHRLFLCPAVILIVLTLACLILPAAALTVTDDTGFVVSFNDTPQRIVSFSPANTEILAALGLADRIVGLTDACDFPPEIKDKQKIGGFSSISLEKVAAAKPDLVVAAHLTPPGTVSRLRDLGIPVVVLAPGNIDDMVKDIRMVGEITGTNDWAETLVGNLNRRLSAVSPVPESASRPVVAHVVWHDPLYVSGNGTLQNEVIVRAGGINAFAGRNGWVTVSLEEFRSINPDIILVNGGNGMGRKGSDVILETFRNDPRYAALTAVREGHIYAVDADIISRPGPRIVDATEQLARLIHPECFTQATTTPGAIPTTPVKSPGFCAGSALLLISLIILPRGGRKN